MLVWLVPGETSAPGLDIALFSFYSQVVFFCVLKVRGQILVFLDFLEEYQSCWIKALTLVTGHTSLFLPKGPISKYSEVTLSITKSIHQLWETQLTL